MLMRFNVGNFLSFGETQEFSMIAGKVRGKANHLVDDGKTKLLKFASIYGANASGKSNLVNAVAFACNMILSGVPSGHTTKYCKVSEENKDKSSFFEFEIKIDDKYFAYGFEIILNKSSIVSEWLIEILPDNKQKEIFVRDLLSDDTHINNNYFQSKQLVDRLNMYIDDLKGSDNVLFLSEMNRNKSELYKNTINLRVFKQVYSWFDEQLDVNFPDRPFSSYSYFMTGKNSEQTCNIISSFGTGIIDFKIIDVGIDKLALAISKEYINEIVDKLEKESSKTNKDNKNTRPCLFLRGNKDFFILELDKNGGIVAKTIEFKHKDIDLLFSLEEESDGTIRLLELIEILFAKNSNKVYFIDEIDRCLHPQLTYKFIENYLEIANNNNMQLVVTTHESRLLDFDLLRRDEIWFVNKEQSGVSSLYSLEEYNERFDKKIDKAYLEGRYGGTPIFTNVFPIEVQHDEKN